MTTQHAIVWIDHSEAHVIQFDRDHVEAQKIKSRSHHKKTGSDAISDEKFYHAVAEALTGVHEIVLTGPAQAKDEFHSHCKRHDAAVSKAIVGVLTTDHPSDAQLVAQARQYFLKHDQMLGDPAKR